MTDLDLTKIGGSDIAAILGVSPWAGPWDVWARIVHGRGGEQSDAMRFGTLLEPVVAKEWMDRHDRPGRWVKGESLSDERWPWARITPDYVAPAEREGLEVKTTNAFMEKAWEDDFEGHAPPDYYNVQAQWYCHALDYDKWHFAVLVGGQKLLPPIALKRDAELGELMFAEAEKFYRDHVATGRPPPVDESKTARRFVEEKYAGSTETRPADEDDEELVADLASIRHEIAQLGDRKKVLEARLLDTIGDAYGLDLERGRVTAPQIAGRRTVNWKAVQAALGVHVEPGILANIIENNTKVGDAYRRITIKV